jgi:hypothetical protein
MYLMCANIDWDTGHFLKSDAFCFCGVTAAKEIHCSVVITHGVTVRTLLVQLNGGGGGIREEKQPKADTRYDLLKN